MEPPVLLGVEPVPHDDVAAVLALVEGTLDLERGACLGHGACLVNTATVCPTAWL